MKGGDMDNPKFNNYINYYIDNEIEPRLIKDNINGFEFSGETEQWCSVLEEMFKNRELDKSKQYIYKFKYDSWNGYKKRKLTYVHKNVIIYLR
ncbi:hypothetical protein [Paraclostridium bifermentans]|uniref:hypothetical protein n=2 Tax=Paraclostridium bifermentans TaxID=1490 RepID=UPI00359C4609